MKSCSTLFSMSKDRILSPGSKESIFSKDSSSTVRSVHLPLSTGCPVARMQEPMSMS